ncbi:hypothetical protein THAOC_05337 [Thalassiosira oceanica]|uniref:Uncharacterized protein n=1 Tax=Thalassiosira oceanica TaxID=159749 RepID=K0T7G7_THAOC|nr:hypothetical protein THAOC_05337 [Thalassiosira oceanica]|eukprot:EJK73064.1 hypothetical protein THAOC_05337 [Thalassiosira oceanica]
MAGLENSALQVGFGYLFDPFGVFSCVCYYNSGQAPDKVEFDPLEKLPLGDSPIKRINTGLSGWGVPTQTDGLPDAKCFPNLITSFTFTDTYKGKIERPRAIFATPIRGFVGDDEDEDVEFAFGGRSWEADFFFALSSEINAGLSVAVTSFGRSAQDLTKATLPAYSFVTSDSMGKLFGDGDSDDFLTGVVSPQGLLLDRNRDLVSVSRKGETLTIFPGSFKVTRVSVEFNSPMNGQPTVILFPVWYKPDESTLDEVFPASAAQLFLTVHQISEGGFEAILDGASPVGFNFLAIGPDIPTKNVKHGLVSVCTQTVPPILSQLNGISIGGECPGAETEDTPGVLLNFDEPFSDIPSVIATPHARLSNNRCIVESITVSSARVKCTENPDDINFIPVPFTFVAIGETAE